MSGATIADIDHIPCFTEHLAWLAHQAEQVDPFVLADLLALTPRQAGTDGRLYRRQRTASDTAERYELAISALRPRARLHWRAVADGSGWRWWGMLLPEGSDTEGNER